MDSFDRQNDTSAMVGGGVSNLWARWVRRLVPRGRKNYIESLRDRSLVSFLLTTLISVAIVVPSAAILLGPTSFIGLQTLFGGLAWFLFQGGVLWCFHRGMERTLAVNVSLSSCFLILAITAWSSSGILAVETPLAFLLPLVALSAHGIRAAIGWLLLVCCNWLLMGLASHFGFEPSHVPDMAIKAVNASLFLIATAVMALAVISISYSTNSAMQKRLKSIAERHRLQARHDGLTHLLNHDTFMKVLASSIERAHHADSSFALAIIDLTEFKQVNDEMGHLIGNQLLRGFARALRKTLRSTDTPARIGGDEFAVVLEGVSERGSINIALDKMVTGLNQPISTDKGELMQRAAIGVALYPADATSLNALYEASDAAMYHSKREGMPVVFWRDIDPQRYERSAGSVNPAGSGPRGSAGN
ncbi:GGDEF domain-containing protein [Aestuariirhabdus sp. LZHN29]|uniref:GGDEF domain-containing protein n=1 Tax=Aestuariirhabdus sp. LZHN29 TaxID=3417462 RepID=UPI003CE93745